MPGGPPFPSVIIRTGIGYLAGRTGALLKPVSYTHLDVYKRQGVYRRGRTREFSPHKEKPPPARTESIELLDAAIQGTAGFVHWYKAGCFSLSQPSFVRCRSPPEAQEIHRNS